MVLVGVVVAIAAVLYMRRRRKNHHVYECPDTLVPQNYCEPISLGIIPTPHFYHQPHPLHMQVNVTDGTLLGSSDHIVMQPCPAYVAMEDTPTLGDYVYIDADYVYI